MSILPTKTFLLFFVFGSTLIGDVYAQSAERKLRFLDNSFRFTADSTKALYFRTVEKTNSGFIVRNYYMSGKLQMEAPCSNYIPEPVIRGVRKQYFENGSLQEEGTFNGDNPVGIHKQYYENGRIKRETDHDREKPYYLHFYDTVGNELLVNGSGVVHESTMTTAKGNAKEYYLDIKNSERFGAFIFPYEDGDTLYFEVEKDAEYNGGKKRMWRDISKHIVPKKNPRGSHGTVTISFTVRKNGMVDDVKLFGDFAAYYDEQTVEAVKKMKRWIPAFHRGRPVNVSYKMSIGF